MSRSPAALTLTRALLASMLLPGCGVAYTIVKSEAKLDRLAVPMTKTQVLGEIGHPDRVLRDDGRMLVWEYSLTARKQWLYELGLCPVSFGRRLSCLSFYQPRAGASA
jgi:outer membrane protein assembly factor BamE (lipoprotein component of BamABCDE complex)